MGSLADMIAKQKEQANGTKAISPPNSGLVAAGTDQQPIDSKAAAADAPAPRPRIAFGVKRNNAAIESAPNVDGAGTDEQPADSDQGLDSPVGDSDTAIRGDSDVASDVDSVDDTPVHSSGGQSLARLAALGGTGSHGDSVSGASASGGLGNLSGSAFTLADIESTEELGDQPVDPWKTYEDMIPADLPPRPLPDDIDSEMKQFVTLVEGSYGCLNEPDMFGGMIRSIMQELQTHPEYDKLLVDADVNMMMRGLRSSMGLAKIKKAEKSKGAGRTGAKAVSKTSALVSTLDNMFAEDDF